MLSREHRLTSGRGFRDALRRGRSAGGRALVVHLALPPSPVDDSAPHPARVGLVVGRSVGNAVIRNHVKRRLRHLLRARVDQLPGGSVLVVRALPTAAATSSADLGADLDRALRRVRPADPAGDRAVHRSPRGVPA